MATTNNTSSSKVGNNPFGMSVDDFAIYKQNKQNWENGINKEMAAKINAELRKKYKIASDTFSYSQLKGYYDQGGVAMGKGVMMKNTLEPERVLSPEMTKSFEKLVAFLPSLTNIIPNMDINFPKFSNNGKDKIEIVNQFTIPISGSADRPTIDYLVEQVSKKFMTSIEQYT